jgi:hypothetical protein
MDETVGVEAFDRDARSLVPGQLVKATVTGHAPWGIDVIVAEEPDVGASIDAGLIDSPSGSPRALPGEYPPIGTDVDAVVTNIRRYYPPVWVRLSIRATDLGAFSLPCGFCGRTTVISPGGDGISMDVRSADGPSSTWFPAHRRCVIERLHPNWPGEPERVATVGAGPPI